MNDRLQAEIAAMAELDAKGRDGILVEVLCQQRHRLGYVYPTSRGPLLVPMTKAHAGTRTRQRRAREAVGEFLAAAADRGPRSTRPGREVLAAQTYLRPQLIDWPDPPPDDNDPLPTMQALFCRCGWRNVAPGLLATEAAAAARLSRVRRVIV